jgi:hypothetical protein
MEGAIILILVVAVIVLLTGDSPAPMAVPPVVIVQSQPIQGDMQRNTGCLPIVLAIVIALIAWALLVGG